MISYLSEGERKISINLNSQLHERRRIDVLVPTRNRPSKLYYLLKSGLALETPELNFIIFDDASTTREYIPDVGIFTTFEVVNYFNSKQICYFYSKKAIGVASHWETYFKSSNIGEYIMALPDKDEFISADALKDAMKVMSANDDVALVISPLKQIDRASDDRLIDFTYRGQLTDKQFYAAYINDNSLKHCAMWGLFRGKYIAEKRLPNSMELRNFGLDDGFGIDLDLVLNAVFGHKIYFLGNPIIKRSTLSGGTEKYPLTFAYTYYQYAKRVSTMLLIANKITLTDYKKYLLWWNILILRGANVSLNPVHGTELENGVDRIKQSLKINLHLYLLIQLYKFRLMPNKEYLHTFIKTGINYLNNFNQKFRGINLYRIADITIRKYLFKI